MFRIWKYNTKTLHQLGIFIVVLMLMLEYRKIYFNTIVRWFCDIVREQKYIKCSSLLGEYLCSFESGKQIPKFPLLGPYDAPKPLTMEDYKHNYDFYHYERLIDLKNFTFKLNPQPCQDYTAGLLLVVIISSNPYNYDKRVAIRSTWAHHLDSTKVVFLMGESENTTMSLRIQNEAAVFGDIVQGNFIDAYRNMTYKHVMGLKWVTHHCPMAKYILKTDDDVVVNIRALRRYLARDLSPWGAKDMIACHLNVHAPVQRTPELKWRVGFEEFEDKHYPDYCAGFAIIYSPDVVQRLLEAAQSAKYFWVDDAHITGVLADQIGIDRTELSSLVLSRTRAQVLKYFSAKYAGYFLFGPRDISVEEISKIWKAIPD